MSRSKAAVTAMAVLALLGATWISSAPADAQEPPARVSGTGSTWAANALVEWRNDVAKIGLQVDYSAIGSTGGRRNFEVGQTDYAVSELPYTDGEAPPSFDFTYVPIVAGGTSLMYNLAEANGQLRLSPATIASVFTGGILKWNDPQIAAENPGVNLPDLEITPVVRADASGSSAHFASYLRSAAPEIWEPFKLSHGLPNDYVTSFPSTFGRAVAVQYSDGVADRVHNAVQGRGAITYVETSYAAQRNRPVAYVKNSSGTYVLPTERNVSIALTRATLNADRTQNLDDVFANGDPNAYPISSYAYMIVPTDATWLSPGKARTLSQFIYYFTCEGQQKAGRLGYAPLPLNLVQAAWAAAKTIPGADAPPAIEDCRNPAIQLPPPTTAPPATTTAPPTAPPTGGDTAPNGFWMAAADGGVFTAGDARFFGSLGDVRLNQPVIDIAGTPSGGGYYLIGADGGVFTFGDADFQGSTGGIRLNQPVVAMAPGETTAGYMLIAADGGVFTFGDTRFYGSTAGIPLNAPIVGAVRTRSGNGYLLIASDGGVFTFGDAGFYGSLGGARPQSPIVDVATTPSGLGYWLLASDGDVFAFGDARTYGAPIDPGIRATGITANPATGGYVVVDVAGSQHSYGPSGTTSVTSGRRLNQPVIAVAELRGASYATSTHSPTPGATFGATAPHFHIAPTA